MPRLRIAFLLGFFIITACSTTQVMTLQNLPAPITSPNFCCWQAQQQLAIEFEGKNMLLNTALAYTRQGTLIVVLDPLGRRLLSITEYAGKITIDKAKGLPEEIPVHLILRMAQLAWWPQEQWSNLDDTQWSFKTINEERVLKHKNNAILSIVGSNQVPPDPANVVTVKHLHQALKISITTQQWQTL